MTNYINYQEKVKEFQIASEQPVSDVPYQMTKDEFDFRDSLLAEEIRELNEAVCGLKFNTDESLKKGFKVYILDALADIKYVNDGTANMIGVKQDDELHERFYTAPHYDKNYQMYYDELVRINCADVKKVNTLVYRLANLLGFSLEVFKTALERVHLSNMSKFCIDLKTAERTKEFYAKQNIETIIEPKEKLVVIYRKSDRKVLKSVEYYPVQLADLIHE